MAHRQLRDASYMLGGASPAFRSNATGQAVQRWEHRQEAAASTNDACMHGFLERVPAAWLRSFIKTLPKASKWALFATNKWLASLVMEASTRVTLGIGTKRSQDWFQHDWPAMPVGDPRGSIITHLLSVRKEFEVQVGWSNGWWADFPMQLADRIVSISHIDRDELENLRHRCFSQCCQWDAMTALRTVPLKNDQDFSWVCEAVEAGHLQQLRKVCIWWPGYEEADDKASDEEPWDEKWADFLQMVDIRHIDRFTQVLCPRLEELCTMSETILRRAQHMTSLHRLTVENIPCHHEDITLTDRIMQQLCQHPTLRHVKLSRCFLESDHSYHPCKWESLELDHMCLHEMAKLPLASVQQILLRTVEHNLKFSLQAFEANLAQYLHKITFPSCRNEPWGSQERLGIESGADTCLDYHKVKLYEPCAAMVPLVTRMQGVEELSLRAEFSTSCSLGVLQQILQVLPLSVRSISFAGITCMQWAGLWQGVPPHVVRVAIMSCDITADDLQCLVHTAPQHIQELWLQPSLELDGVWDTLIKELIAVAPWHLQLYYTTRGAKRVIRKKSLV